jgi:hypothetical protein
LRYRAIAPSRTASGNLKCVFGKAAALRRIGRSVHSINAMPLRTHYLSPAAQARHVLDLTARAWRIPPSSARALARRAPHGHVPLRAMRRLHAAAVLALLPHSW